MSKHTGGPWTIERDKMSGALWIGAGINGDICDLYNRVDGKCHPYENAEANAHLIASSPKMYDLIVRVCNGDFVDKEEFREVKALAEGL